MEQGVPETPVVLIVEEALLRIALADGLRDCGFLPLEARDADQAMEILETAPRITLVLTDIRMPGTIDGFGLAKWIRESRPGLPVLIASGYSGKFNIACELCADEQFFAKPYDVNHIATKMKGAVNARRNRDA